MNYIVYGLVILCFSLVVKLLYDKNKIIEQKELVEQKYTALYDQYLILIDQIYDCSYEEFDSYYKVKLKVKEKLKGLINANDSETRVNFNEINK